MTVEQRDTVSQVKTMAKWGIAELERALGVETALPATMSLLAAIEGIERITREAGVA